MRNRKTSAPLLALFLLVSANSYSAEKEPQALFCTGQTNLFVGQNEMTETNAYIEVGAASTYIEINGVGSGSALGKPKMLSAIGANMPVILKPAYEGGPELKAQFSLNIYSGSLSVIYFDRENKMRSAFQGECKRAVPLINI